MRSKMIYKNEVNKTLAKRVVDVAFTFLIPVMFVAAIGAIVVDLLKNKEHADEYVS